MDFFADEDDFDHTDQHSLDDVSEDMAHFLPAETLDGLSMDVDSFISQAEAAMADNHAFIEQIHASDTFAGMPHSGTDANSLIAEANAIRADSHHFAEQLRQHENEQLVANGLQPLTGDFSEDWNVRIANELEMQNRASHGDVDAQHWLDDVDANDRRHAAFVEAETREQEARNEITKIDEFVRDGDRWLHEKEMERQSQHAADEATNSRDFQEHLHEAQAHRQKAEEIEERRAKTR
jgi:hypothetical protein